MPVMARSRSRRLTAARFRSRLLAILGDCRLLWMPRWGDTTTNTTGENSTGRVFDYDATVAARLLQLGRGTSQSFASGSTQYGSTPDTADLSFGNGTTDSSFSIVVLVNVTDTSATRALVCKNAASNSEWEFRVSSGDLLTFLLTDNSVPATPFRRGDAAITQGSWVLLGGTYDVTAGSGATAATGITLYQNGAVHASTATNAGTYVAMENLGAAVELGAEITHTFGLLDGSMALVAVCQKALSAADHAAIAGLCRQFFGVPA